MCTLREISDVSSSFFFFFFATSHGTWDLSSLIRDRTQSPLHLECGVLTTGLPGKPIFLFLEDNTEKAMATHSSILAWRIPWTEEPGGLWSMDMQRVRHDWATDTFLQFNVQFVDLVLFLDKQLKWFFNSRILTDFPGLCVSLSPSVNHRSLQLVLSP